MRIDLKLDNSKHRHILYTDEIDYVIVDLTASNDDFCTIGQSNEAIISHLKDLLHRDILIEITTQKGSRSIIEGKLISCSFKDFNNLEGSNLFK